MQRVRQDSTSNVMTNETTQVADTQTPADAPRQDFRGRGPRPGGDRRGGPGGRGPRGPRRDRGDAPRSEFAQKMLGIRRVARVMAGGRRFNFSVCMVIGDKKGRVGVGLGKAMDTQLAIEKATRHAKKNMITLDLTKTNSIKHNIEAKYAASVVEIRPSPGRGLVAGSAVRAVLELAGVTDVTAKILSRSHNSINNARAAIEALKTIEKKH
ncbi:30S ribosomal protein S5 [bacterium]|nr:30S ribosomal protein S5 [bacterium]